MRRLFALAPLVALLTPALPRQDAREWLYLNEAPTRTVKKLDETIRASDWKSVFELYDTACERYADRVVRSPEDPSHARGLPEYIRARLLAVPGARDAFRTRYDAPAGAAFSQARLAEDFGALERAIEHYFLASGADESSDWLAARLLEDGRVADAARVWRRLLERLDDDDPLYTVVLARLGTALSLMDDRDGLMALRERVRVEGLATRIRAGGVSRTIGEYLEGLKPKLLDSAPAGPAAEPTYGPSAATRPLPPATGISLGSYDPATDGMPQQGQYSLCQGTYARAGGRDYIFMTTGRRVIALDPTRGDGLSLKQAVYWRHPDTKDPVGGLAQRNSPYPTVFGCAVDGEILVATFISQTPRPAVGRSRPYDGAAVVKAFEFRTGRELWSTESLTTLARGKRVPIFDSLPFGDRDFAFTSAPVIWNGRVYLGVSTNPTAERECHVVCLNLATGMPEWSTFLASATPGQQRAVPMSSTSLAVQEGMVYAATNLGAVAAIHALSGEIRWIGTYRPGARATYPRGASAPVAHGGRVYVLPQDGYELLAFDRYTGRKETLAWPKRSETAVSIEWNRITHIAAHDRGWLVLSGDQSRIVRLSDLRAYDLPNVRAVRPLPGRFYAGRLYLPYTDGNNFGVAVYDRESLKRLSWKPAGGNDKGASDLIIGGDYVAIQNRNLFVYTGLASLERRFEPFAAQDPPRLEACWTLGALLVANNRWEPAAKWWSRLVAYGDGDPKWAREVGTARKWLQEYRKGKDY